MHVFVVERMPPVVWDKLPTDKFTVFLMQRMGVKVIPVWVCLVGVPVAGLLPGAVSACAFCQKHNFASLSLEINES